MGVIDYLRQAGGLTLVPGVGGFWPKDCALGGWFLASSRQSRYGAENSPGPLGGYPLLELALQTLVTVLNRLLEQL